MQGQGQGQAPAAPADDDTVNGPRAPVQEQGQRQAPAAPAGDHVVHYEPASAPVQVPGQAPAAPVQGHSRGQRAAAVQRQGPRQPSAPAAPPASQLHEYHSAVRLMQRLHAARDPTTNQVNLPAPRPAQWQYYAYAEPEGAPSTAATVEAARAAYLAGRAQDAGAIAAPAAAAPHSSAAHGPAPTPKAAQAPADAQQTAESNAQRTSAQGGWMPAVGTALTLTVVLPTLVILHAPVGCWAAGVVGAAVWKRVLGARR